MCQPPKSSEKRNLIFLDKVHPKQLDKSKYTPQQKPHAVPRPKPAAVQKQKDFDLQSLLRKYKALTNSASLSNIGIYGRQRSTLNCFNSTQVLFQKPVHHAHTHTPKLSQIQPVASTPRRCKSVPALSTKKSIKFSAGDCAIAACCNEQRIPPENPADYSKLYWYIEIVKYPRIYSNQILSHSPKNMSGSLNMQQLLKPIISEVLSVSIGAFLEKFASEDELISSTAVTPLEKARAPRIHRPLVVLDSNTSIEHALKILSENRIHAAPVREVETGNWLGCIDMLDIVFLAMTMATNGIDVAHQSRLPDQPSLNNDYSTESLYGVHVPVSAEVVQSWKNWCASNDPETLDHRGVRFGLKPVKSAINESHVNKFIPVYENGTLMQLVEEIFSEGIHRAPVMDFGGGKIVDIISQSDIVATLAEKINLLGAIVDCTVEDLGLVSNNVIAMSWKAQAIHAFWLMRFHSVTGIAVTGGRNGDMLIGNISAADLKYLTEHKFSALLEPVYTFFSNSGSNSVVSSPASSPPLSPLGSKKSKPLFTDLQKPPVVVTKKTTFGSLLEKMALYKVHRVWVVDEGCEAPIAVITTTEIMKMIVRGI